MNAIIYDRFKRIVHPPKMSVIINMNKLFQTYDVIFKHKIVPMFIFGISNFKVRLMVMVMVNLRLI